MEKEPNTPDSPPKPTAPVIPAECMEGFLDAVARYKCVGRDVRVSYWRVLQALWDRQYKESLEEMEYNWTGNVFEGMPWEVCSDIDIMQGDSDWPVVTTEGLQSRAGGYLFIYLFTVIYIAHFP